MAWACGGYSREATRRRVTADKAARAPIIDSEGNGGLEAARKDGTMELDEALRRVMMTADCEGCMALDLLRRQRELCAK